MEIGIKKLYQDKILEIKTDSKTIILDTDKLLEYDLELYESLIKKTTDFLANIKKEAEVYGLTEPIVKILNWKEEKDISKIRVKDINSVVKIDGMVSKITDPMALVLSKSWNCPTCGTIITTLGDKPKNCSCGRKGNFIEEEVELQNIQELIIEELQEKIKGKTPQKIRIRLTDHLTDKSMNEILRPGNRISVVGRIDKIKINNKTEEEIFQYRLFALDVSTLEDEFDDSVNDEELEEINEISNNNPIERLRDSLAPTIYGRDDLKTILLLQMVGGVQKQMRDGKLTRYWINILVVGSPSCVVGDTYVNLADGTFKKIKDLGKNHLQKLDFRILMDHRLPKEPFRTETTQFHKYKNQPTKKIITETGKELICTLNHPLFSKFKKEGRTIKDWKMIKDLKIGDKIKVMNKIPCVKKTYVKIRQQKKPRQMRGKIMNNNVILPSKFDEEMGLLSGLAIGDGYYTKYHLSYYFGYDEEDVIDLIEKLSMKKFNKKIRKKKRKSLIEAHIDSMEIASLFKMEKQPIRRVPEIVMKSKDSVVAEFIKGLFEADGCCTLSKSFSIKHGNRVTPRIQLKSSSHNLLLDTQLLLLRFGIKARIHQDILSILKSKDIIKYSKFIGFVSKKKKNKLKEIYKISSSKTITQAYPLYEKIVKIVDSGLRTVYDIHVPKYHRFVSNGIVSHNTSKSELAKNVNLRCPKSFYTSGDGSSGCGLTATVVRDELLGNWGVEAGPIVKANGGTLICDEIDKFPKDQLKSLHTPLELGIVKITKAGLDFTFPAETAVLALANPRHGIIEEAEPIVKQINLPAALLSRFDVIYIVKDEINKDNDDKITEIIYNQDKQNVSNLIDVKLFRKYISYAKTFKPKLQREHLKDLQEFYHDVRKKSISKNSNMKGMPIGTRHLQGLIRLAESCAKLHLRETVEKEDFDLAKKLVYDSLLKIGMDEGGVFDLNRIGSGVSISQRKILEFILDNLRIIFSDGNREGIKDIELRQIIKEKGVSDSDYDKAIFELNKRGDILKTSEGWRLI